MLGNDRGFSTILLLIILAVIYIVLFSWSSRGWGYMGYRGYRYGPSFWYWGGPSYHYGESVRTGSPGRRTYQGGGLRGGK